MKNGKTVIIALVSISAILFVTTILFYLGRNDNRRGKDIMAKRYQETLGELQRVKSDLDRLEKKSAQLEAGVADSDNKIKALAGSLEEERGKGAKLAVEVDYRNREALALKGRLDEEMKKTADMSKAMKDLEKAYDEKTAYIAELEKAGKESRNRIEELEMNVEDLSKSKNTASLGTVIIRK